MPRNPTRVKTFGIVSTYKSKFGYHTQYKEVRSTTENGAVDSLCIYIKLINKILIYVEEIMLKENQQQLSDYSN